MNWGQVEGNWRQFRGEVEARWGRLTDDELARVAGRRGRLIGTLRGRSGYAKEQAERAVEDCGRACDRGPAGRPRRAPRRRPPRGSRLRFNSHRRPTRGD